MHTWIVSSVYSVIVVVSPPKLGNHVTKHECHVTYGSIFSAEVYNSQGLDAQDPEMRQLVLGSSSNMRWYIVHRCWDYVKTTSQSVNWNEMLKMFL